MLYFKYVSNQFACVPEMCDRAAAGEEQTHIKSTREEKQQDINPLRPKMPF